MIIGVLVELSNKNIDRVFDYSVPDCFLDKIKLGIRVKVPFGKMELEGFVVEVKDSSDIEVKDILDVIDDEAILNSELLELGKKMQEDTLSTLISCYQIMLPKALKAKNGQVINKKFDTYYYLNKDIVCYGKLSTSQEKIINLCMEKEYVLRKELVDISLSSLNTLIKKNILLEKKLEHYRLSYNEKIEPKKELTNDQRSVVDEVLANTGYFPYLLFGVTGSGKTEVYMELIEDALNKGKTSIVLVPEISLTPQMVLRFQKRFGDNIAAIHSALSDGEKYDEWRRIVKGEAKIVIGARSAIFAPLNNIGMIIIDEEHSDSYKQDDSNPRYNAKDIALLRGKYHNCPVIMGSATPSLEVFARAKKGVFKLLELPNRINGKSLPHINIIDMNEMISKTKGHFSPVLLEAISARLLKNEQIILLLNRRGYSSFVTCKNCGYTFKCPNCDITLTYHKSSRTLRCHYCGYGTKVYDTCPECHEKSINDLGVGTEKVEEELNKLFPESKILRMDFDTTSRKGMHEKMIKAFKNHEYDILLGTQIVSKGLDFDNVTLVGVINADTSLNIPDFRSSETTFSLLAQVAGRAGRSDKEGEVIIQTFNPEHYAIQYTKKHDYLGFYNREMSIRRELKYPPYYYICYVKISGKDNKYIYEESLKITKLFHNKLINMIILGPSPCTIFKLNNIYRYGIILKYKKDEDLREVLNKVIEHYKDNRNIKIDVNFNPSHF
ncbi:primosomal protein N' (Replication factor Y) [Mycoplasma sp. CAG:877]|nr:primosomal protein N' (Replication factor Y) [Mycoplasma sp. CAG:877]